MLLNILIYALVSFICGYNLVHYNFSTILDAYLIFEIFGFALSTTMLFSNLNFYLKNRK